MQRQRAARGCARFFLSLAVVHGMLRGIRICIFARMFYADFFRAGYFAGLYGFLVVSAHANSRCGGVKELWRSGGRASCA